MTPVLVPLSPERPSGLAFTFAMPEMSDAVDEVTITIEPDGDGSKMTLEHACYRDFKKRYESGWGTMFGELDKLLRKRATNKSGGRHALSA